jgi:hypothetical protein
MTSDSQSESGGVVSSTALLGGWKHVKNEKPPFGVKVIYWSGLVEQLGPCGLVTRTCTDKDGDHYSPPTNPLAVQWWHSLPPFPPNVRMSEGADK